MFKFLLASLITIMLPWLLFAGTPVWTKTNGPRGGTVYDIAIHPTNPSLVFAATEGSGLFASMNGAENWKPSNYGQVKTIDVVAISKADPSVVYGAAAPQYVLKSIDGGKTWSLVNIGAVWIEDIVLHPTDLNVGYLATQDGVFKTTNAGGQWNPYNTGLTNLQVRGLAMDPTNPNILYAATAGGIFQSTNAALSWTPRNTGMASSNVRSVIIDPLHPLTLYAGTESGISKSVNAGGSWTNVSVTGGVKVLAIDPINSNNVYAGTGTSGMLRSTDYGLSWNPANLGLVGKNILSVAVDPTDPSIVYAGTWGTGLFKSIDSGNQWLHKSNGLNAAIVNNLTLNPVTIFASAEGGVPQSGDGLTWSGVASESIPDRSVHSVAVDPLNTNTAYAATQNGMYKTTGSNWFDTGLSGVIVHALVMSPTSSSTLYAGTWGGGVYKTTNSGSSWTQSNTGLLSTSMYSLAIDPTASNYIYAGTKDGVFSTTNSAGSWAYIGPEVKPTIVIHDPVSHLTVYALVGTKLYKTVNGGGNWAVLKTFNSGISRFAVAPSNTSILYAVADYTIYRSEDGGVNWTQISNGEPNSNLNAVGVSPYASEVAYLGTEGQGIYRLVDARLWDDYNDSNIAGWTISTGSWGALTEMLGASTATKAKIFSPSFDPCSECTIEADVQIMTPNGKASIYGWYIDKANYIQVEMNEERNKLKVAQRLQGTTIWKKSVSLDIEPSATSHIKIAYHGGEIAVAVDGQWLITRNATIPSAGTIGFLVKAKDGVTTNARFDNVLVY